MKKWTTYTHKHTHFVPWIWNDNTIIISITIYLSSSSSSNTARDDTFNENVSSEKSVFSYIRYFGYKYIDKTVSASCLDIRISILFYFKFTHYHCVCVSVVCVCVCDTVYVLDDINGILIIFYLNENWWFSFLIIIWSALGWFLSRENGKPYVNCQEKRSDPFWR